MREYIGGMAGAVAIVGGCAWISLPYGLIAAGVLLLVDSVEAIKRNRK